MYMPYEQSYTCHKLESVEFKMRQESIAQTEICVRVIAEHVPSCCRVA